MFVALSAMDPTLWSSGRQMKPLWWYRWSDTAAAHESCGAAWLTSVDGAATRGGEDRGAVAAKCKHSISWDETTSTGSEPYHTICYPTTQTPHKHPQKLAQKFVAICPENRDRLARPGHALAAAARPGARYHGHIPRLRLREVDPKRPATVRAAPTKLVIHL